MILSLANAIWTYKIYLSVFVLLFCVFWTTCVLNKALMMIIDFKKIHP